MSILNKRFYNTETGELSVTIEQLRNRYPLSSIPDDVTDFQEWTSYTTVMAPQREHSVLEELPPVNGVQQWQLTYIHDKTGVLASIYNEIDDACYNAVSSFSRFRSEYIQREEEAKAYADKGYQGLPGSLLKNFADLIGLPYQAAANVILEQARLLREIDTGIANLRMAKYTITARDTVPEMLVKRDDIILQITSLASKLS